jgi:UDP-2,4-diacetamido-2,4,6-trideoxy-beta-L-altropyranose hydrolase
LQFNHKARLRLRPAQVEDQEKILEWRNDPWITSFSSSQEAVSVKEHRVWFQEAIIDPNHSIHVIVLEDEDIGLVRLHRTDPGQATISIYVLQQFCGRGYGTLAIQFACEKGRSVWPISEINAYTLRSNLVSARSFRKNGFLPVESRNDASVNHLLHLRKVC